MEPFLVRRSRWKLLVLGSSSLLFAVVGLLAALGARSPWVLVGSLGFGFFAFFAFREASKTEPAMVIDDEGIEDKRVGLRLGWDEIEAVRLRRSYTRFPPQTWLLLRVRDLPSIVERIPRTVVRKLGRLDAELGVRTIFFVLDLLAPRPRRILEEIRARDPHLLDG